MKKQLIIIAFLILQTSILFAQKITPVATPEAAGFSSERLKRLDREMNEWAQKEWMNGGVALIIRNGKIAYYKAVGVNDLDTKAPMQKDGIFRIASQTKAITSVAIMILFEEGKLLLDDPVSKYIPAFKKQQVLDKFN
ncbi:MAG: serine hydrolase, partial [Chitinophagaceae bacterium]